jgi:F-type H+-transporting ATPase subunit epsilon
MFRVPFSADSRDAEKSQLTNVMPLLLEIVTPEARIFSDQVDSVVLPGAEGEMGVLPAHAPLVTTLQPGELRYTKGGKTTDMAVGEGLVEVTGSTTRVLTDMAIDAAAIDEKAVEEALQRAKDSLDNLKAAHGSSDDEIAATMAMIQRSSAQLQIKRKRRTL